MKELEGKIILFHLLCGYLPSIISSQEITFHLVEENKRGLILGNLNYFITSKLKTDPRITEFHVSSKYFEIDNQTKNVQMVSTIDLDTICSTDSECCDKEKCVIETKVVVQEYSQYKSSFSLKVEVKDLDDNFPLFLDDKQIIKLSEKISINTSISIDGAMDKDFSKINQKKNYQFFDESMTFQLFVYQYDPDILSIMVMRSLNYELKQIYFCKLKVCDKTYQNCVRKSIIVQVIDENDNEPIFVEKKYLVKIPESYPIGKKILKVTAKDADSSLFNKTFYGFQSNYNVKSIFNIEKESGVISLKQSLSINKKSRYLFTVYAIDALSVTFKKDYADVEIEIEDVNDNYPIISLLHGYMPDPYAIRIDENTPPKTLFSIHVSDKDTGINAVVNCSLRVRRKDLLEMIKADMEIYQIRTIRSFDYEILQLIEAEILCIDSGSPALLSRKAIKIIIVDVNEFEPSIRNNFEELSFKENIPEHKFIMSIDASDKDKGAILRYSLDEIGRIYFTINSRTGEIIMSNVTLDKEMNDSVKFKVFITDSLINPHTATMFVTVTILDQNDNAPQFVHTLPFTIQEGLSFYSKLSTRIEAKDADKDEINHSIIFRLLHTYNNKMELLHEKIFDVSSKGEIETVVTIDREKDSNYTLTILAQDKGNPPKSTSTNITITVIDVNDNSPVWVSPPSLNSSEPEARFNISKEAAIGSIVAQLKALDQDQDDFGKISYVIMSTESHYQGEQFLTLNETSGILSIHQHPLSYGRTLLKISAHDHGHPPLKNYATLIINVQQPNDNLFSGLNMAIIIGMLSITALISIFLIIAIFFIRRSPNPPRHYRHSNQNIRKECDNNLKSSYKDLVDYNDKKESVFTDSDCHHVYYRNGNLDSNLAMYSQSPVEGVCPTYVRFATPGSYLHEMDGESADSGKGTSDLDVAHQSSMKASSTNLYGSIQLIPSSRINYFVPNKPIRNSYQVINEGEQAYNLETFQQQSFSNTLHSPETIPKLCSYQTLSFNSLPPYNA